MKGTRSSASLHALTDIRIAKHTWAGLKVQPKSSSMLDVMILEGHQAFCPNLHRSQAPGLLPQPAQITGIGVASQHMSCS